MNPGTNRRTFHLLDLVGLVVGYSLASLLARAVWRSSDTDDGIGLILLGIAYLWTGFAMSGPILLTKRPSPSSGDEPGAVPHPRSWAETAWLIIGFYWIGLTILIVPVRLHQSRILNSVFLGLFPIVGALFIRFFGTKPASLMNAAHPWTHHAAVGLLWTWPLAWIALILLGKNLL
ncbi:hypothetical protein [Singulisphaera sp. PoT]|uniref:hypothetical protein n=1 Tax=Singulisphaera sp. PoT TaxID=3411797 RepID=UPI003BF5CCED